MSPWPKWASSAFGEGMVTGESICCVPCVEHAESATLRYLQGVGCWGKSSGGGKRIW